MKEKTTTGKYSRLWQTTQFFPFFNYEKYVKTDTTIHTRLYINIYIYNRSIIISESRDSIDWFYYGIVNYLGDDMTSRRLDRARERRNEAKKRRGGEEG